MSLLTKAVETIAKFTPDAKVDPLLQHDGFLGKSLDRVDGNVKVKGEARFTAEFDFPGLVHGALVCSTIARGKVRAMDTNGALHSPGVIEVLMYKNMPRLKAPPLFDVRDLKKGMAPSDLPILQDANVYWDGQPIAVVIAETWEQAEHAASLVRVEYDENEPAVSFDALKKDAFLPEDVLGEPPIVDIADADKGMQESAVRVDQVFTTPRYNHNAIEPHASIAFWKEDGTLVVFESTQSVNTTARTLMNVFDLEFEKVQVIAPFVGGGFGGKGGFWNYLPLCAAAAKVVGRPVKVSLAREAVFRVVGGRTLAEQRVALGASSDGKLQSLVHTCTTATTSHGRYAEQCTFPARHLYAARNMHIEQRVLYLDTVANTWMRAPGESIGTFALESAMDELADALQMDPIELRRRNEPEKDPTKGTPFSSRQLSEAYRQGAERFGWRERSATPRATRQKKWLVGRGVATAYYPYFRFPAKARVRISADGRALIQVPAAEMGMGTATVQIQHAADRLGLPLDAVTFEYGNSHLPDSPVMAGGSNQTASVFSAVQHAVEEAHRELLKLAQKSKSSPLHGVSFEKLQASRGGLYDSKGEGESYVEILQRAGRDSIEVEKQSPAPMELMKYSMASYGAHFCEVRVHEDTGELRVSRWLLSIDCGKVVNPKTAVSQLRGGIIMGIGMAMTEETMFDERRGRITNATLAEYHLPVNLDIPPIDVHFLNIPDEHTPYGARGIGEIGITGTAAAIANAVFNATGRRIRELPITLDKLL